LVEDEVKFKSEFERTLDRLEELNLREKLKAITVKIKIAEEAKNQKEIKSLNQEFRDISLELSNLRKKTNG